MQSVFYVPGSTAPIDYARLCADGELITLHTSQTIAQLQGTYPGAVLGSEEEFTMQMEAASRTEPMHITADQFDDALNALPPCNWTGCGSSTETFKFMERYSGRITTIYARIGERYFSFLDVYTLTHAQIVDKVRNCADAAVPGPGPYGRCI